MKTGTKQIFVWMVTVGYLLVWCGDVDARGGGGGGRIGGGGGARPSMGSVGGGGGRPSMGHSGGVNRPAPSRPNVQRPSMGNASRPSAPSRPNIASRPSGGGGFSPSGSRPNINRPNTRPGAGSGAIANRPSVRPPTNINPSRPSLPGGGIAGGNRPGAGIDRPGLGTGNRPTTLPGNVTRPGIGGGNRPGIGGNRPGIGGGRPGIGERPGIGGGRPGIGGDRPGIGGDRPGIGGDRPGIGGDRPGIGGDRPGIGGGRPGIGGDRPIIGGDRPGIGNRPGIIGGNRPGISTGDINIGDRINIGGGNIIGNRPDWDRPNWGKPGWGWGDGGWAGNWHDRCIPPYHGWYNGCWNGYWRSSWYRPLAWTAVGWGLGSLTSGWGYGAAYYNPYFVEPVAAATVPYDYSQPVVVNNYYPSEESGAAEAQESPETQQAVKLFDEGLALFKSADYTAALAKFDAALKKLPGDPVVHEVRALTLFALGDFNASAAALNSFLSVAPGMDWTTMSSLYGNIDDYEAQLRKLEQFAKVNPNDPAAFFVLAYHYLVIGAKDEAVQALQVVVKNQPKDATAKRMLDSLVPPAATPPPRGNTPSGADAPQTDLVGNWRAKAAGTTIDLGITEDSKFTWKATQPGKPPTELAGQLASSSDQLVLESADQGSMDGNVTSLGPDKWHFALSGAPASDPGLSFDRVR